MTLKLACCLALVFALGLSVVNSCNTDTGTASACSSGAKGSSCSSDCPCASNSSLSCMDGTCGCGLNAQGSNGHSCSGDCPCDTSKGLVCNSGKCECKNTTAQLWDDGCIALTSEICNFENDVEYFVTDTATAGWKCDYFRKTAYDASYNGTSKKGSLIFNYYFPFTQYNSRNFCERYNAQLVFAQPNDDLFREFIIGMGPGLSYWAGITLDAKDNKFYHDNGEEFTGTFVNPASTNGCVSVFTDGTVMKYAKASCDGQGALACRFY